jgi:hypothetical protein
VIPAVCSAALAFAGKDCVGCVRIMEPIAAEVVRIGGGDAQHEMVEDMFILALTCSGETAKAHTILDRRLNRRSSPRDDTTCSRPEELHVIYQRDGRLSGGRPLGVIGRRPRFVTAVICGVIFYLPMNFLMTAAPLATQMCGHSQEASDLGLQ